MTMLPMPGPNGRTLLGLIANFDRRENQPPPPVGIEPRFYRS
jgi:hypothetical protein